VKRSVLLDFGVVYSIMLYMAQKRMVTFRVASDLAAALRKLPNQTAFVESALREALGRTCPMCAGSGRVAASSALRLPDFRAHRLPRLDRAKALELRELVRLGRRVSATDLALERAEDDGLAFRLSRKRAVLLEGEIDARGTRLH
jgi:hypothetical protein